MVRTVKDMLRHFINQKQDNWAMQLPALEFAYNSSVHPTTGYTPFELDLGYHPRQPHQITDTNVMQVQGVEEFIEQQATTMAIAQGQFQMAQQTQALNYNKGRKSPQPFKEGDKVMLSTKYIHPPFLQTPGSKKLRSRWIGPFTIMAKISPTTYRLDLPEHIKAHPTINLEYLKAYYQPITPEDKAEKPSPILVNNQPEWEIENILAKRKSRNKMQYLVKWKGHELHDAA
jgi:hypothetical protein